MKYAVGIDVGGTNTRVALINEKYEIKERVQFGSDPKNPIKTLNQINDVIKGFGEKIEGIGISLSLIHISGFRCFIKNM